ncbi:MAG: VOC family protein [Alphaproteobacteria bacterium]
MAGSGNDRRIDYVEFSVGDIARSRDFYGKAFSWSFKDYGPGYCEFSDGRLTGGFALGGDGNPGGPVRAGGPLVVLYADDLDETRRRLEEDAGARIVKPIFTFPGGRRFHFADPDGYELAVWSDK